MDTKAILQEKRTKLAALKEARNSRKASLVNNKPSLQDINALVDQLIGSRTLPQAAPAAVQVVPQPSLSFSEFTLLEVLPTMTESYEKQCQTIEIETDPIKPEIVISEEKEQIVPLKEEQSVPIFKEFNQQEVTDIMHSDSFLSFFNEKSRIIERAINDTDIYDFMAYTRKQTVTTRNEINLVSTFTSKSSNHRTVTSLDWSEKHVELCLASYNKNPQSVNDPDGLVLVWNTHMQDRPEFTFHAQSDVLDAKFSPHHSNYIVGGTYSGQILLWDTRASANPVLKSPLSQGHAHPVYSIQVVGSLNANHLISASTDGVVCSWQLDMLAHPLETLELVHSLHTKTNEISCTCFEFPKDETAQFHIGTQDGNIYAANRYDRAGYKAGLNTKFEFQEGHFGMVTALRHHSSLPVLLTSSLDWTVRLFNYKSGKCLTTFDGFDDYVMDVEWSPSQVNSWACLDAGGLLSLYNLGEDSQVSIATVATGYGGNKIGWSKNGRLISTGGNEGVVGVYDVCGFDGLSSSADWVSQLD